MCCAPGFATALPVRVSLLQSTHGSRSSALALQGHDRRIQTWREKGLKRKVATQKTHFKKWAFCVTWQDCPLLPRCSAQPAAGFAACESIRLSLLVLARDKQGAAAAGAAAEMRGAPLSRTAATRRDNPGWNSRPWNRPTAPRMKHRPRLWQKLCFTDRLSSEALDYIRQIIIDPAIVYPCCLISINNSLGELARDSVPPPPASSGFVRNKMIYVYSSKILVCWQAAGIVWGWKC